MELTLAGFKPCEGFVPIDDLIYDDLMTRQEIVNTITIIYQKSILFFIDCQTFEVIDKLL